MLERLEQLVTNPATVGSDYSAEGVKFVVSCQMLQLLSFYSFPCYTPPPYKIKEADNFSYTDPVDGSQVSKQGIRVMFQDGSR